MKNNKFILFLVILLFLLPDLSFAQRRKLSSKLIEIRLNKKKPTIFITFEKIGHREPLEVEESNEGIWLKLHNNTRWKISFDASGFPDKSYGDTGVFYDVEPELREMWQTTNIPVGHSPHVGSLVYLSSGHSAIFSIPREHLAKGLMIRVQYNYEWELSDNVLYSRFTEPQHYVEFHSSDLPESVKNMKVKK